MQTGKNIQNTTCNLHAVDCMEVSLQIRELKYIINHPCKAKDIPEYINVVHERFKRIDNAIIQIYVGRIVYVIDTNKSVEKHLSFKLVKITAINNPLTGEITVQLPEGHHIIMNILDGIYLQQNIDSKL